MGSVATDRLRLWSQSRQRLSRMLICIFAMWKPHASMDKTASNSTSQTHIRDHPCKHALILKHECCHFDKIFIIGCIKMTTSSAASDENFIKMTTFLFQFKVPGQGQNWPMLPQFDRCWPYRISLLRNTRSGTIWHVYSKNIRDWTLLIAF